VGAADLGIILGTFLVGVGIFQIPAGFAAMHWGARKVSLAGLLVMGVACVASAFSPTWEWLAGLRFFAGVGAAFFFSPALSLIASYYPTGARGPVIGLYNGSFSIGGAIGLSGGVLIGQEFGWPTALLIGGIAMLGTTGIGWLLLPRFREEEALRTLAALWSGSRGILRSRSIWALSLGLVGFWAAIYVVAQYFVEYASVDHPAWGGIVAGSLGGLVIILSFPGGPVGGWLAERGHERRALMILFGVVTGILVLLIPFTPLWALWPLCAALGFFDGMVFAILYLVPSYLPESRGHGLALGVALVNSVQVLIGSGISILFGVLAATEGYFRSWVLLGVLTIVLLPILLLVSPTRALGREQAVPVEDPAQPETFF
jgi:MFS family permease